jgi:hypothetical protein
MQTFCLLLNCHHSLEIKRSMSIYTSSFFCLDDYTLSRLLRLFTLSTYESMSDLCPSRLIIHIETQQPRPDYDLHKHLPDKQCLSHI